MGNLIGKQQINPSINYSDKYNNFIYSYLIYIFLEFKTWARHQRLFHEVTSGGISFWLKSHGSAVVGLATKPTKECAYEVRKRKIQIEKRNFIR